jgi:hypothetical protein
MRSRWLLSVGLCAVSLLGVRGWAARPIKTDGLVHVAELAGGNLRNEVGSAQYRYLNSQPHHWRECVLKRN